MSAFLCVAQESLVASIRAGGSETDVWRVESNPAYALSVARTTQDFDLILIDGGDLSNGSARSLVDEFRSIGPTPILFLKTTTGTSSLERSWETLDDVAVSERSSPPAVIRHAIRRLLRGARDRSVDVVASPDRLQPPESSEQPKLVSEIFGDLGLEPHDNIKTIVRRTAEVIGGVASLYNRLDDEERSLVTWADHRLPEDADKRDDPKGHICYEATIRGGNRPVVIGEIDDTPFAQTDSNVRRYGLHAYIGFPVVIDGRAVGSLCVVDTVKRDFSDSDVDSIEALAHAVEQEERHVRLRETFRRDLSERDMSIREVQHRIKNDLAIVKATLDLRAATDVDAANRASLLQTAAQIDVMLRVYERLSVGNASGDVEIGRFISELADDLRGAILPHGTEVNIESERVEVPARMAISVGTIINELVTNCVKYAFGESNEPRITISVARRDDREILVGVSDNGVGFPPHILHGSKRGFGLTVTHALAQQHDGSVDMRNTDGASVVVALRLDT